MEINLKSKKPDIRFLKDMKEVLYNQKWAKKAPNFELYYMYRGLKRKNDLRYDITVIPARLVGQEFAKTKGHEHFNNYGELYIVLRGQAIYLMQKYASKNNSRSQGQIKDVYAVKAKKGDVVIVPPKYGHITINPSKKKTLEMANWLDERSGHIYDDIAKKQGACYYYTKNGWIKNKKYARVPKLRFEKPLKRMPKNLDFLHGN